LPQEEILASTHNVFDEAFSAFAHLVKLEKMTADIDAAVANETVTAEMLEEYAELQSMSQGVDKHDALKQTQEVLTGLGFSALMIKKNVNELSTGWKMRLALAKLLLTDADFYLFDEPTNHLDIVTQQWFLQKLQHMRQGFALISHDRAYLEKACDSILEVERGRGTYFKGNLSAYLVRKEEQQQVALSTRARQEREIEQKMATVERFKASASRAKQAQSMLKKIDKIELIEVEPLLPPVHFRFPAPARPGNIILTFNNLTYEFNGATIFKNISGEIQRGERVALVAANGVGKTTLINCLVGKYKPLSGHVKLGHGVQMAYFEQDQARALDLDKTIFQEVSDACPKISDAEIRANLGSFQFSGDDIYKKIKVLSGGEKNRVAMTKILLQRANFLVLDEPTNHLDLYAEDVLRQALQGYDGTMLFVSHNIDFISKLATRIIELTPTSAYSFPGTYEEFCFAKKVAQEQASGVQEQQKKVEPVVIAQKPGEQARELRKKIAELERSIQKLEKDQKEQAEKLAHYTYGSNDYARALARLSDIEKQLKIAQDEWERAAELLG
jgi:ATP-binding cassette subfamily F protein 3